MSEGDAGREGATWDRQVCPGGDDTGRAEKRGGEMSRVATGTGCPGPHDAAPPSEPQPEMAPGEPGGIAGGVAEEREGRAPSGARERVRKTQPVWLSVCARACVLVTRGASRAGGSSTLSAQPNQHVTGAVMHAIPEGGAWSWLPQPTRAATRSHHTWLRVLDRFAGTARQRRR